MSSTYEILCDMSREEVVAYLKRHDVTVSDQHSRTELDDLAYPIMRQERWSGLGESPKPLLKKQ